MAGRETIDRADIVVIGAGIMGASIAYQLAKDGKRYRSLGDQDITFPVDSNASTVDEIITELKETKVPERAGRAMDHEREDAFERLRTTGYM